MGEAVPGDVGTMLSDVVRQQLHVMDEFVFVYRLSNVVGHKRCVLCLNWIVQCSLVLCCCLKSGGGTDWAHSAVWD